MSKVHIQYNPMIGDRHGKLVVISVSRAGSGKRCRCRCDCGNEVEFQASLLYYPLQRHVACCGINGCRSNVKHGHKQEGKSSPTYSTWRAMRARCSNPKHEAWKDYGGRGIEVCERWSKFENFLEDMGDRPEGRELGRIDNNDNYCKLNCRWETCVEQANNRRTNRMITCDGITMTVSQWAKKLGRRRGFLFNRLNSGWNPERAIREAKHE